MKYIKIILLPVLIFLNLTTFQVINAQNGPNFQINQDELNALNLNENEAKEFEQFLTALNNMSPEEQEFLTQLGQELEQQMKDEGLDPSNPDDIFKWVDKQTETTQPQQEAPVKEPKIEVEDKKDAPKEIEIIQIINKQEASDILKDTSKYLSSLRQKASTHENMRNQLERFKLELDDSIYFLNLLQSKDLIKHLISKDFENLYKNIESFYQVLSIEEPKIQAKEAIKEIENPYEMLDITYSADQKTIENKYNQLKKQLDPKNITKRFESEGLTKKELNKKIKQAKLNFKFIQNAYEILKDPKQKKMLDKSLKKIIEQQKKFQAISNQAFQVIMNNLANNLFTILQDIYSLLEKYKPEELEKAKAQEEIEKKILEETKKPIQIIPSAPSFSMPPFKENKYEPFYRYIAMEDFKRAYQFPYTSPYSSSSDTSSYRPESYPTTPSKPSEKPPRDKKDDKKKDDKKKDDKKKNGKKKDDKKPDKKLTPAEKEFEMGGLIFIVSDILEKFKDKIEVERPTISKAPGKKPELIEVSTEDIKIELDNYLSKPAIEKTKLADPKNQLEILREQTAINYFMEFSKANKIPDLWKYLTKLDPGEKAKIDNPILFKNWKEKVLEYKDALKTIQEFYQTIHPLKRSVDKKKTNSDKSKFHGLNLKEQDIEDPTDDIKIPKEIKDKYPYLKEANLAGQRKYLKDILQAIKNVSDALGIKKD